MTGIFAKMFNGQHYKWLAGKSILSVLAFLLLILYENASGIRGTGLYLAIIVYLVTTLITLVRNSPKKLTLYRFMIEVLSVNAILYLSRFSFNLIGISLLMMTLSHAAWELKTKENIVLLIVTALMLGFNIYNLIGYGMNYEKWIELIFIFIVLGFMSSVMMLLKNNMQQKQAITVLNSTLVGQNNHINKMYETLKTANESLEQSKIEVVKLTEKSERSKIARELHDAVGHELTGLIMELEMIKRSSEADRMLLIDQTLTHARDILVQTRQVVVDLDDAPQLQLEQRLYDRIERFERQTGTHISAHIAIESYKLNEGMKEVIYRSFLEALTNIAKHSAAKKVNILMMDDGEVFQMKVINDGGRPEKIVKGKGLTFMTERLSFYKGTLTVEPYEDGVCLTLRLPLKGRKA
jgi:signal transduction histidine kinase